MGLCFCKESQTEEFISQNEVFDLDVLEDRNLSFFTEEVPDAMDIEKEQLTEDGAELSVECEEDPEGLGGKVVFGNQSFPLSF